MSTKPLDLSGLLLHKYQEYSLTEINEVLPDEDEDVRRFVEIAMQCRRNYGKIFLVVSSSMRQIISENTGDFHAALVLFGHLSHGEATMWRSQMNVAFSVVNNNAAYIVI